MSITEWPTYICAICEVSGKNELHKLFAVFPKLAKYECQPHQRIRPVLMNEWTLPINGTCE